MAVHIPSKSETHAQLERVFTNRVGWLRFVLIINKARGEATMKTLFDQQRTSQSNTKSSLELLICKDLRSKQLQMTKLYQLRKNPATSHQSTWMIKSTRLWRTSLQGCSSQQKRLFALCWKGYQPRASKTNKGSDVLNLPYTNRYKWL